MKKQYECKLCKHKGVTKKKIKGSFLVEVILWLFFIIPGLIYSIWRLTTKDNVCSNCGHSSHLVPIK